jgi:hypothetical protein
MDQNNLWDDYRFLKWLCDSISMDLKEPIAEPGVEDRLDVAKIEMMEDLEAGRSIPLLRYALKHRVPVWDFVEWGLDYIRMSNIWDSCDDDYEPDREMWDRVMKKAMARIRSEGIKQV